MCIIVAGHPRHGTMRADVMEVKHCLSHKPQSNGIWAQQISVSEHLFQQKMLDYSFYSKAVCFGSGVTINLGLQPSSNKNELKGSQVRAKPTKDKSGHLRIKQKQVILAMSQKLHQNHCCLQSNLFLYTLHEVFCEIKVSLEPKGQGLGFRATSFNLSPTKI